MRDEQEDEKFVRQPSAKRPASSGRRATRERLVTRGRPVPPKRRTSRSEFDFINQLRQQTLKRDGAEVDSEFSASSLRPDPSSLKSSLVHGIGDDAAVMRVRAGCEALVTADLLVEDVDFRRAWTTPRLLGHKALAVSLSDIAAMGARPCFALLCVGLPQSVWRSAFLDEFYEGFFALADAHGVRLVGGDVSRTPERMVFDSVVLGEAARGRGVLRAGARAGDRIFVTGALGGAAAGLRLLESGARLPRGAAGKSSAARKKSGAYKKSDAQRELLLRHMRPNARVAWGRLLGERRLATAMIDLSDGLSGDLAHLCRASGVGAKIDAARVPVEPAIEGLRAGSSSSAFTSSDALRLALDGGEDYELLFTVRPRSVARLPAELDGVPVTEIGEVTDASEGIKLLSDGRATNLRATGFQHFSRAP